MSTVISVFTILESNEQFQNTKEGKQNDFNKDHSRTRLNQKHSIQWAHSSAQLHTTKQQPPVEPNEWELTLPALKLL